MDLEKLARKAITLLRIKFGIPEKGFLAGGSIANIIWEMVSGNKSVINDIDIFLHESDIKGDTIIDYKKFETRHYEAYNRMTSGTCLTGSYQIKESTHTGFVNTIKYTSTNKSPQLIIDSFDINCTQIGYSIEEDKFYWTESFVEFLQTGDLKITNLNTPAHTAIRIIKKKDELNLNLDDKEIKIAMYALDNKTSFYDITRVRFLQRYADIYQKYSSYLNGFFELKNDTDIEKYLTSKEIDKKIYYLQPISLDILTSDISHQPSTSNEFLFYMRNVFGRPECESMWNKLHDIYRVPGYIDKDLDTSEIDLLVNITSEYPRMIQNLRGLKASEQIFFIKNVITKISEYYDYNTAIAVLENYTLTKTMSFDEDECLLLGLSVRTKTRDLGEQNKEILI